MIATDDYARVREAVGVVDRSDRGKAMFRGPEAADFLQGQVTNDVEGLAPGTGCYAALLTPKGKMLADMRILRGPEWFWLDTEAVALPSVAKMIRTYSIGRDVRPENLTDTRAILSLVGPGADAALDMAPPPEEHAHVEGEHGLYVRTDLGVDLICDAADLEGVRAALGVDSVPDEVVECLRVESGRPRYGIDLGDDVIPQEADLNARAVSFEKGCYVGQETVARLHYKGKPNRALRGLRLDGPAATGDEVRLGDRVVGRVGSAAVSPVHGAIALGLIRREAEPGQEVEVGDAGRAVVTELPF
ncbi:MAG: YgfZ/GcvT domain-containing protein [Thermoleophilaceae bacterium]